MMLSINEGEGHLPYEPLRLIEDHHDVAEDANRDPENPAPENLLVIRHCSVAGFFLYPDRVAKFLVWTSFVCTLLIISSGLWGEWKRGEYWNWDVGVILFTLVPDGLLTFSYHLIAKDMTRWRKSLGDKARTTSFWDFFTQPTSLASAELRPQDPLAPSLIGSDATRAERFRGSIASYARWRFAIWVAVRVVYSCYNLWMIQNKQTSPDVADQFSYYASLLYVFIWSFNSCTFITIILTKLFVVSRRLKNYLEELSCRTAVANFDAVQLESVLTPFRRFIPLLDGFSQDIYGWIRGPVQNTASCVVFLLVSIWLVETNPAQTTYRQALVGAASSIIFIFMFIHMLWSLSAITTRTRETAAMCIALLGLSGNEHREIPSDQQPHIVILQYLIHVHEIEGVNVAGVRLTVGSMALALLPVFATGISYVARYV